MASHAPDHTFEICSSPCRSAGGDKIQWAIVYDPLEHDLYTEMVGNLKHFNNFEVHLPRWRYRVNIHVDDKNKSDSVASIHLGQLGISKNLKRWRRSNYNNFYLKGSKPWRPKRNNESSE